MPLFYILSGMFYKDSNVKDLLKKRGRSLLIPFFLFFVFTSLMLPCFLHELFGYSLKYYEQLDVSNLLFAPITKEIYPNPPIWFLLSLFEVTVLFCLIRKIKNSSIQMIAIVLIALLGVGCAIFDYNIGGYIDTSFTVIPFYFIGFICFHNQQWKQRIFKQNQILLVLSFVFLIVITRYISFDYRINTYNHVALIYPLGIIGTYLVVQVSMILRKVNALNFAGKNSLTILCTHFVIVDFMQCFVDWVWGVDSHLNKVFAIVVFVLTMLLEYFVVIPNKNLPKKCFNNLICKVYAKN